MEVMKLQRGKYTLVGKLVRSNFSIYICACPGTRRQNRVSLNHVINLLSISNGYNFGYSQVSDTPDEIIEFPRI